MADTVLSVFKPGSPIEGLLKRAQLFAQMDQAVQQAVPLSWRGRFKFICTNEHDPSSAIIFTHSAAIAQRLKENTSILLDALSMYGIQICIIKVRVKNT